MISLDSRREVTAPEGLVPENALTQHMGNYMPSW